MKISLEEEKKGGVGGERWLKKGRRERNNHNDEDEIE